MTAQKTNPLAKRLAAAVAKTAPSVPPSQPPAEAPAVAPFPPPVFPAAGTAPSAPPPPAQKPLKQTKTYSLNPDEITKIERAMDFLRGKSVYDASKAAIVRAMIRRAAINEEFLQEVLSDKD